MILTMKKSLLTLACMVASLPLLAGNNIGPIGWATCSDEAGTAFTLSGGNFSDAKTVTLRALGGGQNDDNQIKSAIAKNDIIILDGSNGDFTIEQNMKLTSVKNKTIIGINNARLCTKFYLTDADIAYLKQQNLEGLSSTKQISGTLPDGTYKESVDERAFYTMKAMMELQYQKTGVYALPNKSGIFHIENTSQNIIIRNLSLIGPGSVDIDGSDLITNQGKNIWIDHCTLVDSQDGALDSKVCDWSTYTYNHFYYTSRSYSHAYTCGCGWADGQMILHLTFARNMWGEGCVRRLPQCGDCYVHLLNNYHNCPDNSAGMTINENCKALVEGNFAAPGVKNPLTGNYNGSSLTSRYNNFVVASFGQAVTVPYQYTLMAAADVPGHLTGAEGAGATLGNDPQYIMANIPTVQRQSSEGSAKLYYFMDGSVDTNASGLSVISFEDGAYAVLNNSAKTWSNGTSITLDDEKYTSIKLSNGAENIFYAPEGKKAIGVTFYSYVNIKEEKLDYDKYPGTGFRPSFWATISDQKYSANGEGVTMLVSRDPAAPDVAAFTFAPVTSFSFKNSGEQLCFLMKVTYGDGSTGIVSVNKDNGAVQQSDVYYNLMGQPVAPGTRGVLIYQGKKIVK